MIELKTISYASYENTRMSMCYKTSASSAYSQLDILIDLEVGTKEDRSIRDKLSHDVRGTVKTLVDNYSGGDNGNIRILANDIVEQVTSIASPYGSNVYVVWRVEANNLFDDFIIASSKNKSVWTSASDIKTPHSEPESSEELNETTFWLKFVSAMNLNLIGMIKSHSARIVVKLSSLMYTTENEEWYFTPHPQKDTVICVHSKDIKNNVTKGFELDFNTVAGTAGVALDLIQSKSIGEFKNAQVQQVISKALIKFGSDEGEVTFL